MIYENKERNNSAKLTENPPVMLSCPSLEMTILKFIETHISVHRKWMILLNGEQLSNKCLPEKLESLNHGLVNS